MSRIRRLRTEQGFIYAPSAINAAMDATADDVAHAVYAGRYVGSIADVGPVILGGLECSVQDGLELVVESGTILHRDNGVIQMSVRDTAFGVDLDVHDTDPRWDRVYATTADGTRAQSTQGRVGDVPANVVTMSGSVVTILAVKGVADPAPTKPDLPAGAILIADVWVPADSGAPTVIDRRPLAVGSRWRPEDAPIDFVGDQSSTAAIGLVNVVGRAETADDLGPGPSYTSGIKWDRSLDYPFFARGRGTAEEEDSPLYPMLVPGGRSYNVHFPFFGWSAFSEFSPERVLWTTDDEGLQVDFSTISEDTLSSAYLPIPMQQRGLQVFGCHLVINKVVFGTPGIGELDVALVSRAEISGAETVLGTLTVDTGTGAPGRSQETLGGFTPKLLGINETLFIRIRAAKSSGTTSGRVRFCSVRLEVREGKST